MGNCKSKNNVNGDDHIPVQDDIEDDHFLEDMYNKKAAGKALDDVVFMRESVHNRSEEDEYYHSDDGDSADYSEWDIIHSTQYRASNDEHWSFLGEVDSIHTLNMEIVGPEASRSKAKVRFSVNKGQHTNHVFRSSGHRDRAATTNSMDSVISDSSTVSTGTIVGVFDSNLLPTRLQVFLSYNHQNMSLRIGVKQLESSLDPTYENERVYWQVQMTVLPFKKQKRKTKYKRSTNPEFSQAFEVKKVRLALLRKTSVRYRVYGRLGRTGRKRLAGEVLVELASLSRQRSGTILEWKTLRNSKNKLFRRDSFDEMH